MCFLCTSRTKSKGKSVTSFTTTPSHNNNNKLMVNQTQKPPHTKALASLTKVSADIIVNFFDNYWILHDQLRILVFFKKDRSKCLLYLHISYFLFWNTNTRKDYYVINELQHLRCDFGGLMNSINFKTVFCITAMHLSHSKTTVSLNITDGKVEVYTLMFIPPIFV